MKIRRDYLMIAMAAATFQALLVFVGRGSDSTGSPLGIDAEEFKLVLATYAVALYAAIAFSIFGKYASTRLRSIGLSVAIAVPAFAVVLAGLRPGTDPGAIALSAAISGIIVGGIAASIAWID